MTTRFVRYVNNTDKLLLRAALLNAGIKARVRSFPNCLRVVFEGDKAPMIEMLNNEGFLAAGGIPFGQHSFNGSNEVFVHHVNH